MLRLRSARTDYSSVRPERSAKRVIEGLAFALLLAGCAPAAPTVIDGSSQQSFEQSVALARRDLPDADRLDFDRALAGVPARRYADRDPDARRRITFGGQTAAQVVEDYRRRAR